MKSRFVGSFLLGLALCGCGQKETPPSTKTTPTTPPPTAAPLPSVGSTPAPPPPPAGAPPAAAPAAAREVPTYEGKDEAERITKALHDYYDRSGAEAPLITSLEALVKAGYLKSVPVPPPGKKYVVDKFEVRLVNK